jgi:hypothetical protein
VSKEMAAAILTQTYFENYKTAGEQLQKQAGVASFPSPGATSQLDVAQEQIMRIYDSFFSQLEQV